MNVYLRSDDQPPDGHPDAGNPSGYPARHAARLPPWPWKPWRRPHLILTGLASAILVTFYVTPAGQPAATDTSHVFAEPGCANPQWLAEVPPRTVLARSSRGYAEWAFPRDYDIRLVCLAGGPAGPAAGQAARTPGRPRPARRRSTWPRPRPAAGGPPAAAGHHRVLASAPAGCLSSATTWAAPPSRGGAPRSSASRTTWCCAPAPWTSAGHGPGSTTARTPSASGRRFPGRRPAPA